MDVKKRVDILTEFLKNAKSAEQRMKAIKKLEALPMTLELLMETGIGKTVNRLRHEPAIGMYAKMLVKKWKQLAVASALEKGKIVLATRPTADTAQSSCSATAPPPPQQQTCRPKRRNVSDVGTSLTDANGTSFEEALSKVDSVTTKSSSHGRTTKRRGGGGDHADTISKQMAARRDAIIKTLSSSMQQQQHQPLVTDPRVTQPSLFIRSERRAATEQQPVAGTSSDYLQDVLCKRKNQRAHVYAGRKNAAVVKALSLFDICIRILCDNIDELGYTGGIPTDILRPILLRATPAQLYSIENYNPYLIKDTDDIWKKHCNKEFAGVYPKLEQGETWRQLYQKKVDERNKRLLDVTATIAAAQAMQAPKRATQLADAKTPREVLRRQMKYGTGSPLANVREVVQSKRDRDVGSQQSRAPTNKAPLMAKLIKQCRRF